MRKSLSRMTSGRPEAVVIGLFLVQIVFVLMLYPLSVTIFGIPAVALGYMSLVLAPFVLGLLFNRLVDAKGRSGHDEPSVGMKGAQQ